MADRKTLSKKLRFEVFKRDSFTCQYCGRKAPDVLLQADHIHPVSEGGTDDLLNLITSCVDCNAGKSNRVLLDTAVIDKRRSQLEALEERRQQIDMMFDWQRGLVDVEEYALERLSEHWSELVPGWSLNEHGLMQMRKLVRKFGLDELVEAMRISAEYYVRLDAEGKPKPESVELAWKKVGGVCATRKRREQNPDEQELYYIRGILRNKLCYCNDGIAIRLLRQAHTHGASVEQLRELALDPYNWTEWRRAMEEWIDELSDGPEAGPEHG